jgi:hypothetical protein
MARRLTLVKRAQHALQHPENLGTHGELARSASDDAAEENGRQARALADSPPESQRLFAEFRRKLAAGEAVSRALARLAEALRFSGRITVTLHQGKVTKTTVEESYFGGRPTM